VRAKQRVYLAPGSCSFHDLIPAAPAHRKCQTDARVMHNNFTPAMENTIEHTTVDYDTDNSSRLSSPMSRSPTPPSELNYPSPASSQLSSLGSTPSPDDSMHSAPQSTMGDDNSPPTKRRKLNEPKQHKTEYLDLSSGYASEDQTTQLERLLKVIHKKRKIVVIAGAGISVSAGSK